MRPCILGYGFKQIKILIFNNKCEKHNFTFLECNLQNFIMGLNSETKFELAFGPSYLHMFFVGYLSKAAMILTPHHLSKCGSYIQNLHGMFSF
jgi:hypothetical protein